MRQPTIRAPSTRSASPAVSTGAAGAGAVTPRRIQRWVEEQVDGLRAQASAGGVRLGRLVASSPSQADDRLIAVDRGDRDEALEDDLALAMILTDMATLGLRPRLFVIAREPGARRSRDAHGSAAGRGAATADPTLPADLPSSRLTQEPS